MGVKGLNTFIKTLHPTIFKQLPNRFEALRGKRIVIDATLITQRYHYARRSYEYRHIQGWFRLARDLERAGVSAVCVFDGSERSEAKAEEVQRRRDQRQLITERWKMENARYERLCQMKGGIKLLQHLNPLERTEVFKFLDEPSFARIRDLSAQTPELPKEQDTTRKDQVTEPREQSITPIAPSTQESPEQESAPSAPLTPASEERPLSDTLPSPNVSLTDVISIFKTLHISYNAGLAKLTTISAESEVEPQTKPLPPGKEAPDILEAAEATVMTKRQSELSEAEGQLWAEIIQSRYSPTSQADAGFEQHINKLVHQSYEMSESFDRRKSAPDTKIYGESQELLQALGVPCIITTGGIEAEALASSIVLAGHADYVASEDTDVMIYEATLLKNVTQHDSPLITVSGSDMRESLDLTRSQFLDFTLLLGTDFTYRIGQLGPVNAYKLIKAHGSIERIIENISDNPKFKIPATWDTYLKQVNAARLVFQTLPPIPSPEFLKPKQKDDKLLADILKKYGLAFFLMRDDAWDYELASATTVGGNYFGDDPSTWR
ncbi:Flap endonuclease 1 [Psilocybe cubensis]|uniref:Flap endonuclease 1 n=1 Tax=Psilocybe cubensis TaxID=181762 RepID=A0ACB8GTA4_PSICU|nr:Flap endonuclease 1 [Psilocybe cubensis]KAH9478657.1 Flap endonuclease 1 [Psilocybe cubensis]